ESGHTERAWLRHALVVTHEACEFTGELDHLSGRAVLLCARAAQPTKVIRVTRSALRRMASAEPDIGEIILRAFILRRVGLIHHRGGGSGGVRAPLLLTYPLLAIVVA